MFKKVNKEKIGCPVIFNEEIFALFRLKMSQIGTEKDKKPKIVQFLTILCNFCQRIRGLECGKRSTCPNVVGQ